jgi:hypothetical protein
VVERFALRLGDSGIADCPPGLGDRPDVEAALNLWKSAVAMPEPKEPAAVDLDNLRRFPTR